MQTSQVFNQRAWPTAGDADDCWIVASLMAAHAVAPWEPLPTVRAFRAAAGDPDDGHADGGNVREIMAGLRGCFPRLAAGLEALRGAGWAYLETELRKGRPVSVAVVSAELPPRLRYGFDGLHQVTVAVKPAGVRFANPLAPAHSRWDEVGSLALLKPAVMAYGRLRGGESGAWGVLLPTEAEAFTTHPLYRACDDDALADARAAGYAEAKAAAARAVSAI